MVTNCDSQSIQSRKITLFTKTIDISIKFIEKSIKLVKSNILLHDIP